MMVFVCVLGVGGLGACSDDDEKEGGGGRVITDLGGTWELAEGAMDKQPASFPAKVPVPGLISLAKPAFSEVGIYSKKREAFWYRHTFTAPTEEALAAPTRAELLFGRAKYGLKVWLNGKELGSRAAAFTVGRFDCTDAIKYGAENVLVARIGADKFAVDASQPTHQDMEKLRWIPGIYGRVELITRRTPHFERLKVDADPATGVITVTARIRNGRAAKQAAELDLHYQSPDGTWHHDSRFLNVAALVADPGKTAEATVTVTIPNPLPWTPDTPALYVLDAVLWDAGRGGISDRQGVRFGFRTVAWKSSEKRAERGFFLNGQKLPLVGSNITLHRYFEDSTMGTHIWDRKWITALFKTAKSVGMNTMRISVGRAPELWYDVADEVGILLGDEFMMWTVLQSEHKKWSEKKMVAEFEDWITDAWNHPSIAWWDASNETLDPLPGKVIAKVRGLDPTRQWENGGFNPPQGENDPIEDHPYKFLHVIDNKIDNLENIEPTAPQGFIPVLGYKTHNAPKHPYIVNEYGWLWVNRDGTPAHLSKPVYRQLLGKVPGGKDDALHPPAVYREAYAYLVGGQTRMWRAKRAYDSVQHFVFLGYSRSNGETSDNFIDVLKTEIEPRWKEHATWAFAKVVPFIDRWQLAADKSGKLTVPIIAINDRPQKTTAKLAIMALDKAGKQIASHAQNVTIDGRGQWQGAIQLADAASPTVVYAAVAWKDGSVDKISADVRKVAVKHVGVAVPALPKRDTWP